MKSLWNDDDARAFVERHAPKGSAAHAEALALRVYTSRLIGREADLVLHGGGNTSLKTSITTLTGDTVECLFVKGSGSSLDRVEPRDFPALDLAYLRRLRTLPCLSDEEMVNQLRTHLFDASSPNPSVEALLHAFLPHRFVDHSHADAVLALTNQPDGEAMVRDALGDRVAILPYIMPGFPLARAVADAYEKAPQSIGVALLKHGIFSFGDSARESYERHIALVDACERFAADRATRKAIAIVSRGKSGATDAATARTTDRTTARTTDPAVAVRVALAAPMLRGLLAEPAPETDTGWRRLVMDWRGSNELQALCATPNAAQLFDSGPLTPDHVIRTKAQPLFVANPAWEDADRLRTQLTDAVAAFRRAYDATFERCARARGVTRAKLDSAPRVVLLPGAGALCFGRTKQDATIAGDLTEHTLRTKALADAIGRYEALSDLDLFDMEYWSLEQAKLGKTHDRALERQVVLVTGGAGAIGRGISDACAAAGAHVVVVDIDEAQARAAASDVAKSHGAGSAIGVAADVTDETSLRRAFDAACTAYGGIDVVVPNAGIALVKPIEELSAGDARRVAEVNYLGVLLSVREAARVFRAQGTGGHVVINASKNVFAPGKDFVAYSASKAAAHQVGKIAAIELAPLGVRVNMINADAVFSHGETKSGLWETVGPSRAKSRGLSQGELEAFYRDRNLLRTRVEARHVGQAVVFFASSATPTTGATLPVDGGIAEAFPR